MSSPFNINNMSHIEVFVERRSRRILVGTLKSKKKGSQVKYIFEYDEAYFKDKLSIPLGPEFPLTKRIFKQKNMFASLLDRVPSSANPAYEEYCKVVGIHVKESDPMILLGTLGKKGPSSFIFEPVFYIAFQASDLKHFRNHLGLSIREFAKLFDISFASVARIEDQKSSGKDVLKRAEIYARFPETALFELNRRGRILTDKKRNAVETKLKELIPKRGATFKG